MSYYDSDGDLNSDADELAHLFLNIAKNPKDLNELYNFSFAYISSLDLGDRERNLLVELAFDFVLSENKC